MFQADTLRQALEALGVLLAARGHAFDLVVVGGSALLLHGTIVRPTRDVDAIAIIDTDGYVSAKPLPAPLLEAIHDTANLLSLDRDWLNAGPTDQLKHGLPDGFRNRTNQLTFGSLTLHIAGRFDLICLKLHASVDSAPGSKHVADLQALAPTSAELARASIWVKAQDASIEFAQFVEQVIAHIEVTRATH